MSLRQRAAFIEVSLHDLGYDVFDQPRLHASERRRLTEGRAIEGRLKDASTPDTDDVEGQTTTPEGDAFGNARYRKMRAGSKTRAHERFKEKRDL